MTRPVAIYACFCLILAIAIWLDPFDLPHSIWIFYGALATAVWLMVEVVSRVTDKLKANPVQVEIKPNIVTINGEQLQFPFSSSSHLFASEDSMTAMLERALSHIMSQQRSWLGIVPRLSAQVTVMPQGLHFTDFESSALGVMLDQDFISPEMEVVRTAAPNERSDQATQEKCS